MAKIFDKCFCSHKKPRHTSGEYSHRSEQVFGAKQVNAGEN